MKTQDLAYWIQGHFELGDLISSDGEGAGIPIVLNSRHHDCILKHIALVKTYEGQKTNPFVHWLEGLIVGFRVAGRDDDHSMAQISKEIREKIAELFVHVIDPSYGDKEMQETLTRTHGPRQTRNSGIGSGIQFKC